MALLPLMTFRVPELTALLVLYMVNRATVAYVQNQGSTHSRSLMEKVVSILSWPDKNLLNFPAFQNHQADLLSRNLIDNK